MERPCRIIKYIVSELIIWFLDVLIIIEYALAKLKEYKAYHKTFGETAVSEIYSFKLPTMAQKDFTALIFNDLHNQESTLNQLYSQVKDVKYDFVVLNGDCIDAPHEESDVIRVMTFINNRLNASSIPLYYVRGNHEIRDAYSLKLRDYLDFVNGKTYTAFNWGDTRFVVLDCGEDKPDSTWVYYGLNDFTKFRLEETEFLKKELASKAFKTASKRVLIHHIPIFGNTDEYQPCAELWRPLMKNAPFNISINAHVHEFSYLPKKPNVQNYPVVIGGGPDAKDATVMVLQKKGSKMTLKVIKADGQVVLNLVL
jgi:Icc-related predicted phosphoesterase